MNIHPLVLHRPSTATKVSPSSLPGQGTSDFTAHPPPLPHLQWLTLLQPNFGKELAKLFDAGRALEPRQRPNLEVAVALLLRRRWSVTTPPSCPHLHETAGGQRVGVGSTAMAFRPEAVAAPQPHLAETTVISWGTDIMLTHARHLMTHLKDALPGRTPQTRLLHGGFPVAYHLMGR